MNLVEKGLECLHSLQVFFFFFPILSPVPLLRRKVNLNNYHPIFFNKPILAPVPYNPAEFR